MQTKEYVEIDCTSRPGRKRGPRDRDVRTQAIVRRLTMRHDDVQRIGGAALKETDQRLSARALERCAVDQLTPERGSAEEARAQPHRHDGERTRLHENSAIHDSLDVCTSRGRG